MSEFVGNIQISVEENQGDLATALIRRTPLFGAIDHKNGRQSEVYQAHLDVSASSLPLSAYDFPRIKGAKIFATLPFNSFEARPLKGRLKHVLSMKWLRQINCRQR